MECSIMLITSEGECDSCPGNSGKERGPEGSQTEAKSSIFTTRSVGSRRDSS